MQTRKHFVLLSTFVVLAMALSGNSQTRSHAHSPRPISKVPAPKSCYTDQAFDQADSSVPPHYCGIDIRKLYNGLHVSALVTSKTEFESTDAYQTRVATARNQYLLAGIKPSDLIAFVVKQEPEKVYSELMVSYDADTEQFMLKLGIRRSKFYLEPGYPDYESMSLQSYDTGDKEYVGQNAMGVKVNVIEYHRESYGLAVPASISSPSKISRDVSSLRLQVPASSAPAMKPLLAVALVGNMLAPWTAHELNYQEATIDDPVKFIDNAYMLVFQPQELIVFRTDTGEILQRTNERNGQP